MILNKRIFLFYLMFLNCCLFFGQTTGNARTLVGKGEVLKEVIVTATRTKKNTADVAVPFTLVSEKQIEAAGSARLNEILGEQTGIVIVPDESGFQGIQIQGLDADYTLILIDGVPLVGRSSGNFDLRRLSVGNIKQVEIIKGPSSALYGSEALAGVINIITKEINSDEITADISYQVARFNQQDFSLNVGQKIKKLTYSGFFNQFRNDGYDLNTEEDGNTIDPFKNYTLNANVDYEFSEKFKLKSKNRFFKQTIDASIFSDGNELKSDSTIDEIGLFLGAEHAIRKKTNLFYEAYYTKYKSEENFDTGEIDDTDDTSFFASEFDRQLSRGEVRSLTNVNSKSNLIIGAGYQYDFVDRTLFGNEVSFSSQYVFGQYDVKINNFLNVVAGTRFDNHSEYDNQLSPKLAVNIEPIKNFRIKPSIGYGFKAPDFRQLFFDFTNPSVGYTVLGFNVAETRIRELIEAGQIAGDSNNIDFDIFETPLKAESSIGYNLGFSYEKKKFITNLNLFYNDIDNLIDTQVIVAKTNGQNVFSYRNFDDVFTTGLEFDASYKVTPELEVSGGYQLLYAYDKEKFDEFKGDDAEPFFVRDPETNRSIEVSSSYFGLPNRSRHNANLKVNYKIPSTQTSVNTRIIYRSKYGLFDTNGNGVIDDYDTNFVDGYALVNMSVQQKINDHISAQLGTNNLLNHKDVNIPSLPGIQPFFKFNYKF